VPAVEVAVLRSVELIVQPDAHDVASKLQASRRDNMEAGSVLLSLRILFLQEIHGLLPLDIMRKSARNILKKRDSFTTLWTKGKSLGRAAIEDYPVLERQAA